MSNVSIVLASHILNVAVHSESYAYSFYNINLKNAKKEMIKQSHVFVIRIVLLMKITCLVYKLLFNFYKVYLKLLNFSHLMTGIVHVVITKL